LADLNAFFALISPTLAQATVEKEPKASTAASVSDAPDKQRIDPPTL